MITAELFLLLKLFTTNAISWWWLVIFIASDWLMWWNVKMALQGEA